MSDPARTFSLMANIDELNAAWMVLRSVQDKADFLDGQVHGVNQAAALEGMSPSYCSGFKVGSDWRAKTEEYRRQQSENGKLGGRPSTKSGGLPPLNRRLGGAKAMPKLSDTGLQITDPLPREELNGRVRTGKRKAGSESLEAILGGGKGTPTHEGYWKLVETFGGATKNPAPKATAKLYADAITTGTTPELILSKAQELRNATSDSKYMPQLRTWLEGEGWRNPSLPPPAPGMQRTAAGISNQRDELAADYLAQNAQFFNGGTDGKTA